MNKNSRNIIIGVVVVILIVLIVWVMGRGKGPAMPPQNPDQTSTSTPQIPVSETTKVSGNLSKYQNAELGISVQYPTAWQKGETPVGIQFVIPIDQTQVSTVNRLEADISISSGKCAFPPVTTVEKRDTLVVGTSTLNMISMSNTVQGRSYFNRMYSLQKGSICYFFSFSYVALSPDTKKLTGSNLTQAQNNNKAMKTAADDAFIAMVKSLVFLTPPVGQDESKATPI